MEVAVFATPGAPAGSGSVNLKSSALVGILVASQHPSFWSALFTRDRHRAAPTVRIPLIFYWSGTGHG